MTNETPGSPTRTTRREVVTMETPEEVATMLSLHAAGMGSKRIAKELGCSRNTVRRYLRTGGWAPYATPERSGALDDHQARVEALFDQHNGNAEVVRQELVREKIADVSTRTVQRAVKERRRARRAEVVATVRFETPPGKQIQADFGELWVTIGGVRQKVFLCVLTLAFSRRVFVQAFRHERQGNWLVGMEGAFQHFGGVADEMLIDNARALVKHHDVGTGEVQFTTRFAQFASYWGFRPRACAPYRARTKGKDERGVGYVKSNAIAGRTFESWEALDAWLAEWTRDVADVRIHGTTGERPCDRYERAERNALRPLHDRAPFVQVREFERKVHNDACVEVYGNWYTVPWRLVGCSVTVRVRDHRVTVSYAGRLVAEHAVATGRRQRVVDPQHWEGLVRAREVVEPREEPVPVEPEFARSLDVYAEAAA